MLALIALGRPVRSGVSLGLRGMTAKEHRSAANGRDRQPIFRRSISDLATGDVRRGWGGRMDAALAATGRSAIRSSFPS